MTQRALLGLVVATAVAIVAVSLVPGWIVHVRHQGGHGLTEITAIWNAWQGRAWPILPIGVAAAALAGALAAAELLGRRLPGVALLGVATLALACVAASLVPLDRTGYASRVVLTPAWPALLGLGLSIVLAAAALAVRAAGRRALVAAGAAGLVLVAAGYGGRMVGLNLAEGDPRSFRPGTYLRDGSGGQPADTLVIGNDTFQVADRWSGTFEGRGLVVALSADPACPDVRGSYRIFPAGEDAIRWNTIVDLCADGARAADLTAGIWRRAP